MRAPITSAVAVQSVLRLLPVTRSNQVSTLTLGPIFSLVFILLGARFFMAVVAVVVAAATEATRWAFCPGACE